LQIRLSKSSDARVVADEHHRTDRLGKSLELFGSSCAEAPELRDDLNRAALAE
jgi:hypothetical protein